MRAQASVQILQLYGPNISRPDNCYMAKTDARPAAQSMLKGIWPNCTHSTDLQTNQGILTGEIYSGLAFDCP